MNILSKLSYFNTLKYKLLGIAILSALCFVLGWKVNGWRWSAKVEKQKTEQQAQVIKDVTHAQDATTQNVNQTSQLDNQHYKELKDAQATIKDLRAQLRNNTLRLRTDTVTNTSMSTTSTSTSMGNGHTSDTGRSDLSLKSDILTLGEYCVTAVKQRDLLRDKLFADQKTLKDFATVKP